MVKRCGLSTQGDETTLMIFEMKIVKNIHELMPNSDLMNTEGRTRCLRDCSMDILHYLK